MNTWAQFSEDRRFRYQLVREWDAALPKVAFIGLNPSTADETVDDPTIRRCMGFARAWGRGGLLMLNLYAFRATIPADMWRAQKRGVDVIGEGRIGFREEVSLSWECAIHGKVTADFRPVKHTHPPAYVPQIHVAQQKPKPPRFVGRVR